MKALIPLLAGGALILSGAAQASAPAAKTPAVTKKVVVAPIGKRAAPVKKPAARPMVKPHKR